MPSPAADGPIRGWPRGRAGISQLSYKLVKLMTFRPSRSRRARPFGCACPEGCPMDANGLSLGILRDKWPASRPEGRQLDQGQRARPRANLSSLRDERRLGGRLKPAAFWAAVGIQKVLVINGLLPEASFAASSVLAARVARTQAGPADKWRQQQRESARGNIDELAEGLAPVQVGGWPRVSRAKFISNVSWRRPLASGGRSAR